jgi:hypothetical protein
MTRRLLLMSIALQCLACRAQREEFCDKVFACDLNAAGDPCGPSCRGKPMTCYAGSQLGGTDFCAEACDPEAGSDDPAFTCTTSGALLLRCHPDADAGAEGCPAGLQCYRTDIPGDEGVCMALHVCKHDSDCPGPERTICAATVLNQLAPGLPNNDHLQCLQPSCGSTHTMCPPSEACLADYYSVGSAPDICVPRCDGKQHCPPNFACVLATSGAGSPSICIPGVPGDRCVTDQDCLLGSCFDTGAGFSECVPSLSCQSDQVCGVLNSSNSTWACSKNGQTSQGTCVSTTPFHGANCNETADAPNGFCPDGRTCYRYSPYNPAEVFGECRVPCDDSTHTCPAIGGIPHVCLADGAGGCYPSSFALPCTTSADCLTTFACLPVSPDERTVITSQNICTEACATDDDCRSDPFIKANGFCKEGLCRIGGIAGTVCDRDAECREGVCLLDQSGLGLCTI